MSNRLNDWLLPSKYVPTQVITLSNLTIKSGEKITITDNWGRNTNTGAILITEEGRNSSIDKWAYFQSLLFDFPLLLQTFQSYGHEVGDFKVTKNDNAKHYVVEEINYNDIGKAVYGLDNLPKISYVDTYMNYISVENQISPLLKNYFLAYGINFHKTLRLIDTSYWQVVIYISIIESMLPQQIFCRGKCNICDQHMSHPKIDINKELQEILFSKITDKVTKREYFSVINDVSKKIRNNTVHNGFEPTARHPKMAEGTTNYTTKDALSTYHVDHISLELLVEQLQQITRSLLLNMFIMQDIFPKLKGFIVHSVTLKPTQTTTKKENT